MKLFDRFKCIDHGVPVPLTYCKHCGNQLLTRGIIKSRIRKLFHLPHCAVICWYCHLIIGWERGK
jgi:RNase P subunit RPR2